MPSVSPVANVISNDSQISTVMSIMPSNAPLKIIWEGRTGILLDEVQYDGLLETIRILQENPTIVQSLAEREDEEFISEDELLKYV